MTDLQIIDTPEAISDKYRYIKLLGEGSNGKTWQARNIIDGSIVAIKELKFSEAESLKSFELFKREAEVLKSLSIKGIPKFYESIFTQGENASCYLVQEFVSEKPILTCLEEGRKFTELETLKVLIQISLILEALHTQYSPPIIHRDIKPSNILCTVNENDKVSQAWLIDFGAVANPKMKSGGSTVAGTYGYMAPEQMIGECTTVSDIYAMGATALHMLTGKPPYEIQSDVFRLKYDEVLDEYAPNVSQGMKLLLSKLLEPVPEKRLQTATELTDVISKLLKGELVAFQEMFEEENNDNSETNSNNNSTSFQGGNSKDRISNRILSRIKNTKLVQKARNWISDDSWEKVTGTVIQKAKQLYDYSFTKYYYEFEYIYEVNSGLKKPKKLTYIGYITTNKYIEKDWDIPIPSSCVVLYRPDEPAINRLISINDMTFELLPLSKINNSASDMKDICADANRTELNALLDFILNND